MIRPFVPLLCLCLLVKATNADCDSSCEAAKCSSLANKSDQLVAKLDAMARTQAALMKELAKINGGVCSNFMNAQKGVEGKCNSLFDLVKQKSQECSAKSVQAVQPQPPVQLPARVEPVTKCVSGKVDLVFVVDESGSVRGPDFQSALMACAQMVNQLSVGPSGSRVALVTFNTMATVRFNLNTYSSSAAVQNAIRATKQRSGGTNIPAAMARATDSVFTSQRAGAARVMILITDGFSISSPRLNVQNENRRATSKGITTYVLGVGRSVKQAQLIGAAGSSSRVFNVANYSGVQNALSRAVMCK